MTTQSFIYFQHPLQISEIVRLQLLIHSALWLDVFPNRTITTGLLNWFTSLPQGAQLKWNLDGSCMQSLMPLCHAAVSLAPLSGVSLDYPLPYLTSTATSAAVPPLLPHGFHQSSTCILYLRLWSMSTSTPPGSSFHFTILFALQIWLNPVLVVQLAQFISCILADIQSVSTGLKLCDLTLQVDWNNVFSAL